MKKGYLVLENGKVFEGQRFGYDGQAEGELVFNTCAVGYIETLTDPCNYGLIVMQTFPQIGNYGWISEDAGDKEIFAKAYVVREWCEMPSNFRSEGDIDAELEKRKVVGLSGIDTREVTRILRENGVVNAVITDDPSKVDFDSLKKIKITDAVKNTVKDTEITEIKAEKELYKAVIVDLGNVGEVTESLSKRGFTVVKVPYETKAEEINKYKPDAVVISNGAGDPEENGEIVATVRKLYGKTALLGIGLGADIVALAAGAEVYKMKNGHRGGNHPVKCSENGKTYITAQNHGYAVTNESIEKAEGKIVLSSGNDGSAEGFVFEKEKAVAVLFTPAFDCRSNDTEDYVFSKLIENINR